MKHSNKHSFSVCIDILVQYLLFLICELRIWWRNNAWRRYPTCLSISRTAHRRRCASTITQWTRDIFLLRAKESDFISKTMYFFFIILPSLITFINNFSKRWFGGGREEELVQKHKIAITPLYWCHLQSYSKSGILHL